MKTSKKNIFFFLKMSLIQFLVKRNFNFYNQDRTILFGLLANNKITNIQNAITINENNEISINSFININKSFLDTQELYFICNYINETSKDFSCYLDTREEFNYLNLKNSLHLVSGTLIDDKFWERQLLIQTNNMSAIIWFLLEDFPKSKHFKNKELNSEEFKLYFIKRLNDYIESLNQIIEEVKDRKKKKINYNNWNKKEIEREIDKELIKYKENKDTSKLNLLIKALKSKK